MEALAEGRVLQRARGAIPSTHEPDVRAALEFGRRGVCSYTTCGYSGYYTTGRYSGYYTTPICVATVDSSVFVSIAAHGPPGSTMVDGIHCAIEILGNEQKRYPRYPRYPESESETNYEDDVVPLMQFIN